MERRLAAILAADVVGYSRLMEADEAGTLAALQSHREGLIDPAIAQHHGRIVKLMGDGALVEFASVVDAVACAAAIQSGMAERNADVPEERQIEFRIGVHLGDVMVEGDDLYGDGVNVAARLEGLAEPGGICISRQAFDQVETKLEFAFQDLGDQQVKNIARPVRAYRVRLDGKRRLPPPFRHVPRWGGVAAVAALLALALAAGGAWQFWRSNPPSTKPSIAVLPFDNIGGDEDSGRLADGITEDIITDLARFPEFDVVARNSTAVYKGVPVVAREVGDALHVGYVLEGSIQRQEGRVRITAQLIDAKSGKHVWSERWDRPAGDVFAVQTEIAEVVTNQLGGGAGLIQQTERNAVRRKRPDNLSAYELYLLGTEKLEQMNRADVEQSIGLLTRATELDPGLARAWVELSHAHSVSRWFGADRDIAGKAALDAAERAVRLDPSDAEAHAALGSRLASMGEIDRAKAAYDKALRLSPGAAEILTFYSGRASTFGEPERGADAADRAIRLNPNYPIWAVGFYAHAYFMAGRYEDAVHMQDRQTPENYGRGDWVERASALAALGRSEEAKETVQRAVERHPDLTIEAEVNDPELTESGRYRLIETMRLAGFPACADPGALAKIANPVRLPECTVAQEKQD